MHQNPSDLHGTGHDASRSPHADTESTESPLVIGEPYCAVCGYVLTGAVDSAVCPECGKPLVEVLMRRTNEETLASFSYVRRSEATLFGVPLFCAAYGRDEQGRRHIARGFIAVGEVAIGVIAFGNVAVGVVAVGAVSIGVATLGGLAIGAVTALGGMAVGGMAVGGWSVGLLAMGGGAVGVVATGGGALGWCAQGGGAIGAHVIDGRSADPFARQVFASLAWFFGTGRSMLLPFLWTTLVPVSLALISILLAVTAAGPGAVREALALLGTSTRDRRAALRGTKSPLHTALTMLPNRKKSP